MSRYNGHYQYRKDVIENWNSNAIGVYYCGHESEDTLMTHYVGRAIGDGGIRERLLCHIREDNWPGVTHFGYVVCATPAEAIALETAEIARLQPKYNTQGTNDRVPRYRFN